MDDNGSITENKENYVTFTVKTNIKLAGVKNGVNKEVCENICLNFMSSVLFSASILDKLASNLYDDQCKK